MADPVNPLNSYSAQINLTSQFEMVRAWPCMANTSCNWCQNKEDKLAFVTMQRCSDKSYGFHKNLLAFMGFIFSGTHCTASDYSRQSVNSEIAKTIYI